jgi:hypothetical protein
MIDANFHKEGPVASAAIKGNIGTFQVKMAGLGNYFIKIGATTVKRILDQYVTDISSASGWSGVGIAEGTALYLEQIGQEAAGQSMLNAFNGMFNESFINEAEKFKSTKDFEEFCEEIDGMPEQRIKRIMGKDYIDTPGGYRDEAEDYDNDITEYMISNMGRKDFEELKSWWENNVAESTVVESGFRHSDPSTTATHKAEQLKKLKKLRDHREETDRIKKAQLKRAKAAGSAKESLEVNEAEINSDEEFNEYAMTVLKKAFGAEFDEAKAKKVADGILAKSKGDYGTAVGMLTSSLYWADYNTDTSGQGNKEFANKSKDFEDTFSLAVAEWNDEADGAENRIKGSQVDKVKKLAQEFFKKEGYISVNIAQAMIAQES